jgi:hypothetical protein
MTREELLDALEALREDVLNAVIHNTDYALYSWAMNVIYEAEDHIQRPALRKWTADDGTPPDGVYATEADIHGTLVEIKDREAIWLECDSDCDGDGNVIVVEELRSTFTPFETFAVFYGPIEAEGER